MIPFSFENITRSASRHPLPALPVSAAARATHESFESHLQRTSSSTLDQPPGQSSPADNPRKNAEVPPSEPPRDEPVREDADESRRDDTHVQQGDHGEATNASPQSTETSDEDFETQRSEEDEVVLAATLDQQHAATQELALEASGNPDGDAEHKAVDEQADATLDSANSELDESLLPGAEGSVETEQQVTDDASADVARLVRPGEPRETTEAAPRDQPAAVSQVDQETDSDRLHQEIQPAETAVDGDDARPSPDLALRRNRRHESAVSQQTDQPFATASKPAEAALAAAASEFSGQDDSPQHRQHKENDATAPSSSTTTSDAVTTATGTPSRFAQHLLSRMGDPNGRASSMTDADQGRFVDRVARAVQASGERGGTLRLRLSPPELGSLTLEVKVQGGVVSARVEAHTSAARSLLLENLPLLREQLAEHGMRVDQFDVDLNDRHTGGTPDGLQQHDQQQERRPRAETVSAEPEQPARPELNASPSDHGDERLNIII